MTRISSFPPIEDAASRILILGSMASVKSLEAGEYYAHPQNQFWKIIFSLTQEDATKDYERKKEILKKNHIALCDVLAHCIRPGSMDADITDPVPNDLNALFRTHPIRAVFCNGQTTYKYYKKFFQNDLPVFCMPSTSPANARLRFEEKLEAWSLIKKYW